MRNFYKILLAVFLLPALSYAQSNYKPGYVVNLKGDTTYGFINYKEWDYNPRSIAFKEEAKQSGQEAFTINDISSFDVTGQLYYERHIVPVSRDGVELSALSSVVDTSYKIDTVFLQVLNKGKFVTFFSYKDDLKTRYYLLEAGQTTPYELAYHVYYNNESASIQYIKRFRTQIISLAQRDGIDNDRLNALIAQSNYSESDLTPIVEKINGNTSRQFTTPRLFGTRWFAGGGTNLSKLVFTGFVELDGAPASKSQSPKIDAGIDFFVNKNIQRFYFRVEAAFTYGQYNFSQRDNTSITFSTSSVSIKQYNTAFIPQIVYNIYNKEQLKVFIDVGYAINFAAYNHYKLIKKYDSFPTETFNNYPLLTKNYYTFPIKVGIAIYKNLELYGCYIPTTSITQPNPMTTNFQSNLTSYQVGLNYLFK